MAEHTPFDLTAKAAPVLVAVLGLFSFFEVGPDGLWSAVSRPTVLLGVALLGSLLTFLALAWRFHERDRLEELGQQLSEARTQLHTASDLRALHAGAERRAGAAERALEEVRQDLTALRVDFDAVLADKEELEASLDRYHAAMDGQRMLRIPRDQVATRLRSFHEELEVIGPEGEGLDELRDAVHEFLRRAYTGGGAAAEFARRQGCWINSDPQRHWPCSA